MAAVVVAPAAGVTTTKGTGLGKRLGRVSRRETAEGADVPQGRAAARRAGGRARGRHRDAAREQREVFQSRDGSRPDRSIVFTV